LVQQRDQLAARLDHLRRAALSDESAALRIAEVQETLATVGRRIENRAEELQRLTIVAPRQGTVLSVPPRGASPQGGMLPQWTDSPLEAKNLGAYLEAGTPLCRVGDPERLDAIVAIDQADVERICADQRVDIQLAQSRGTVVRSRIAQVSRLDRHDAQRRGAQWQDDRSVTPTANTAAGWNIAYQASVPLELTTGGVFIGTTGKARIHAGYQTVAQRLGRYLARTFNFQR